MSVCVSRRARIYILLYTYLCICVHACEIRNVFAFIQAHVCLHGQDRANLSASSSAACGLIPFPSFLLSGPASDHPSVTTATSPAVFNGKGSPKHPQLAKSSQSALPRPSALGSAAEPWWVVGVGVLLFSRSGLEGSWELQVWGHGAS